MSIALTILGFLVGVHLTINLFGALYRIIDLGFDLKHFWLEILSRIALHLTLIFLVYSFVTGAFYTGFIYGQVFFTLFHIIIFWFGQLLVTILNRN